MNRAHLTLVALLALTGVLAGCAGEAGSLDAPPPVGAPPSVDTPVPAGTGQLTVTVLDASGQPLAGASFQYSCGSGNTVCLGGPRTNEQGVSILPDVRAGERQILAVHALGWRAFSVSIEPGATATATVVIVPLLEPTASILKAQIPAGSISADRSELDLHLTVAVSSAWNGSPHDGHQGTASWLSGALVLPCEAGTGAVAGRCMEGAPGADVSYQQVPPTYQDVRMAYIRGQPVPAGYVRAPPPVFQVERSPYSALLMLDQGQRMIDADLGGTREYAARNFLLRSRAGDEVALAGFAGHNDSGGPPWLSQGPVWIPPTVWPAFSSDSSAWAREVATLAPLASGSSPLYDALEAGMDLLAAQVPATRRRALVVLTGSDDDGGLTSSQRSARWVALVQKQAATGVEVVLVAGHEDARSPGRRHLADLAATGFASLVMTASVQELTGQTGYVGGYFDDYYSSLDLAADLLAGTAPIYQLTYRLRALTPGSFVSGSRLYGELQLWDLCEPGWWECARNKPFAAAIP